MGKKRILLIAVAILACILAVSSFHIAAHGILSPRGTVAASEKSLIIRSTLLMLIVVIPVYVMTFAFAWRYRENNHKAKYSPDWDHSLILESIWWGIPFIIIVILAGMAWRSSHDLDPFRSLNSETPPVHIQVIALQWKWLFIYPQQQIASVNYFKVPVNTPIDFDITSDAPMNSFWIPQLGGQVYAMSGMKTQLHLMANKAGDYRGLSANISGSGFSKMIFTASAGSQDDFNNWIVKSKSLSRNLNNEEYAKLASPSVMNTPVSYSAVNPNLYENTIMKYMAPMRMMPDRGPANARPKNLEKVNQT